MSFTVKSASLNMAIRKANSGSDCAPILYIVGSWQSEMKGHPTFAVRARPQTPTLRFKDGPADCQSHPATLRFGRKKRLEYLFFLRRRQAWARIADRNLEPAFLIQSRYD
jgi:hypothetical protein